MEKHQFTFHHPYGLSEPTTNNEEQHKELAPKPRGARACMSCRRVKMKCVGGDDTIGKKCERCERNGSECVFEQHRRGRKPGAGLSESSKMLRRLEKGLPTAKTHPAPDTGNAQASGSVLGKRSHEDDGPERGMNGDGESPRKASYFKTILNPPEDTAAARSLPGPASLLRLAPPSELPDPIAAGLLDEPTAETLFAQLFARLNPFIALFDPALHTVQHVRARSPFLLAALLAAACKFFRPALHAAAAQLAHAHAVRAFAEGAAGVEVAQAFVVLTYWREPEDGRAWAYIGYACRMAVELGLNRSPLRPHRETEREARERRNGERTYLMLFVLDRSLSMQTGRQWMLPEDEFVRHSAAWLDETPLPVSREDVIVAACVQLRRISGDTADALTMDLDSVGGRVDCDILLRDSNERLNQWAKHWRHRMSLAGGDAFHFAFLRFFQLHVRLFLNSFGVRAALRSASHARPNMQALDACYSSAVETLEIVTRDFAPTRVLPYAQDNVTVMTAYSAIFLLELLRSPNTSRELEEGAPGKVHALITHTAQAYSDAAEFMPTSASAAHHAQFLRRLLCDQVERDDKSRAEQRKRECQEFNVPARASSTPYPQEYSDYRQTERPALDRRNARSPYPARLAPLPEASPYSRSAHRSLMPFRAGSPLPPLAGPSSHNGRRYSSEYTPHTRDPRDPRDMEHTPLPPPYPQQCFPSDYAPRPASEYTPRPASEYMPRPASEYTPRPPSEYTPPPASFSYSRGVPRPSAEYPRPSVDYPRASDDPPRAGSLAPPLSSTPSYASSQRLPPPPPPPLPAQYPTPSPDLPGTREPAPATEHDVRYWRNMFRELGFGEGEGEEGPLCREGGREVRESERGKERERSGSRGTSR